MSGHDEEEEGSLTATRPTMKDVAKTAGVSLKTVSRVINEEPGVAEATAARVVDAIAELGFERNDLARSLRQGYTSATLGLVIEDVANPFFSSVAQGVEAVAHDHGFLLITASAGEDADREREMVTALLRRRVDALLVVPAGPDHRYISDVTPTIFLDRPPGEIEADTVLFDDHGGARRAVEHLIEQGHRRIAAVADTEEIYTHAMRLAGFRAALRDAGIEPDPALVRRGNRDLARSQATVEDLLALPEDRRPTAIFSANNRSTVGAMQALSNHPGRLALVGFDDFELADLLRLSVIRADPWRLGREAAELAFSRLAGDRRPPRTVIVDTQLIPRGSGEVAP
jgi:LacI family transcriptional regulator